MPDNSLTSNKFHFSTVEDESKATALEQQINICEELIKKDGVPGHERQTLHEEMRTLRREDELLREENKALREEHEELRN